MVCERTIVEGRVGRSKHRGAAGGSACQRNEKTTQEISKVSPPWPENPFRHKKDTTLEQRVSEAQTQERGAQQSLESLRKQLAVQMEMRTQAE